MRDSNQQIMICKFDEEAKEGKGKEDCENVQEKKFNEALAALETSSKLWQDGCNADVSRYVHGFVAKFILKGPLVKFAKPNQACLKLKKISEAGKDSFKNFIYKTVPATSHTDCIVPKKNDKHNEGKTEQSEKNSKDELSFSFL